MHVSLWRGGFGIRTFASSAKLLHGKWQFNILFLGTDTFALETLKALHQNRMASPEVRIVNTLHAVSTSSKTPVADFAHQHDIALLEWPLDTNNLDLYHLGVLASFGRLVPRKVIAKFSHGILNVHPSLLPRWRGASPIMHTVLNNDQETGVSIMSIQPKHFDIGPILSQRRIQTPDGCSAQSLAEHLAQLGAMELMSSLRRMPEALQEAEPQSSDGVTYAHKGRSWMAWVDWERHNVQQIQQQYRALAHMFPLRTTWNNQTIKLTRMVLDTELGFTPCTAPGQHLPHQSTSCTAPGEHVPHQSSPCTVPGQHLPHQPTPCQRHGDVSTKTGAVLFDPQIQAVCVKCVGGWVAFRSVVLKKPMSAADFHNGYLSKDKHKDVCFNSHPNGLFGPQYFSFVQQPKVKKENKS